MEVTVGHEECTYFLFITFPLGNVGGPLNNPYHSPIQKAGYGLGFHIVWKNMKLFYCVLGYIMFTILNIKTALNIVFESFTLLLSQYLCWYWYPHIAYVELRSGYMFKVSQ